MPYVLPDKIKNLTPYTPVTERYPVRLDANESYFDPYQFPDISRAISKAVSQAMLNRYPDPGAAGVCRAFAKLYRISEKSLTAGNGSDELISLICGCLLSKGGKVLTLTPDFSMYRFYGELYELELMALPKPPSLQIDVDAVLEVISREKIDLLIFSNPCNPTSLLLSREKVLRLLSAPCLVVVDEAYMEFCEKSQSVLDMTDSYDNLIVLKTCSKAVGMAGIRLGFAAAGPALTRALQAAKSPYNINSLTQAVGEAVLSRPDFLQSCRDELIASRKSLEKALREGFSSFPQLQTLFQSQTNFVFMKVKNAAHTCRALQSHGILVREMGEYLRVTAGTKEENERFLQVLSRIWREQL